MIKSPEWVVYLVQVMVIDPNSSTVQINLERHIRIFAGAIPPFMLDRRSDNITLPMAYILILLHVFKATNLNDSTVHVKLE